MNRERIADLEEDILGEFPDVAGTIEPYVYADPAFAAENGKFLFPIMTDALLSLDWEQTDQTWFVDSSGFDGSGPALSPDAFRRELAEYVKENPDHGFGITGVGQFQVYVSAYRML